MVQEIKKRFSAMLLFQFRAEKNGISNKRRVCEERIIVFESQDPDSAYELAKQRGNDEEFSYFDEETEVFFEFIGIVNLIELGESLDNDEVWWRMFEKVNPLENRNKLIPNKEDLDVFNSKNKRKLSVP